MKKSRSIKIIVDGTVDYLPFTDKSFVTEVKLHTFLNDVEVFIEKEEFYKKILEKNNSFRTSQANPDDFLAAYKECKEYNLIVLTISSKLSGTFNSAVAAKKMMRNCRIEVIDSMAASAALGILVDRAVSMIKEGASFDEITSKIYCLVPKLKMYFIIKSLDYLVKGGRVNKVIGALGTAVKLKPILELRDGEIKSAGMMLLLSDFTKGFHNFIKDRTKGIDKVYLIHNNFEKETSIVRSLLEKKHKVIVMDSINPTLGIHLGPDCLAAGWVSK